MYLKPFPNLSKDTVEAVEAAFGKSNVYVMIGNMVNTLFADLDLSNLYPEEGVSKEFPYLLSLVTVFQYNEGIADRQAAEATRVRTDWKYALHLPLSYPGVGASAFCDFRRRLLTNDSHEAEFQHLLARLKATGYLPEAPLPGADADILLQSVCTRSRLELVTSAMAQAVQTLVATRNEWLRRIVRPHWYQRYSRDLSALQFRDDCESQIALAESIGADGLYLLKAIAQEGTSQLAGLAEIQSLKQLWDRQFERRDDGCKWRASGCANCIEKPNRPP